MFAVITPCPLVITPCRRRAPRYAQVPRVDPSAPHPSLTRTRARTRARTLVLTLILTLILTLGATLVLDPNPDPDPDPDPDPSPRRHTRL